MAFQSQTLPVGRIGSRTSPVPFDPDLGSHRAIYRRLVRSAETGRRAVVDQIKRELQVGLEPAATFSLNVLRDITAAGGEVWARDSRLFASWPDWEGPSGRENARRALANARDAEKGVSIDRERLAQVFLEDMSASNLGTLAREGTFELASAEERHPSGVPYTEAFSAALKYWTMPYRGRTGRMIRFVLTVRHNAITPIPKVVGILELGDEAPFCSWRDELIGLSLRVTEDWLVGTDPERALTAEARLRRVRGALRPLGSGLDLSTLKASEIFERRNEVEALAAGRSTVMDDEHDVLFDRRRAIYALRLALGEIALRTIGLGEEYSSDVRRMLSQGTRALRDLMVPRLHMEVTVCGALPPFSEALGGKLVVAQFAHPSVIEAVRTPLGDLIGRTFYADRLSEEISSPGMIAITTKGLYQGHSPLYNRSAVPGTVRPIVIKKIAETAGQTSTLMSRSTVVAARNLLASIEHDDVRRVSNMYGSGGAKRHRVLEVAAREAGISPDLVNAGIRRPVYGTAFVQNADEIAWHNAGANWIIDRSDKPSGYMARAVALWRKRWLASAEGRLSEKDLIPGLLSEMVESR